MRGTGRVKQRDRLKGESAHTAGLLSRHPPYECPSYKRTERI